MASDAPAQAPAGAGSLESRITMPSKDQIPEASSAAANEGDTNVQVDGGIPSGDGPNLREPEWDVEVKLADLQADPNNPLFSAKSFEELQLYFSSPHPGSVWARANMSVQQETGGVERNSRNELSKAVKDSRASPSTTPRRPTSKYDCTISVRYWKNRRILPQYAIAGRFEQS